MSLSEKIFNKLSLLEGFYDYIRVVNPRNNLVFNFDSLEYSDIPCYRYFENEFPCENCICNKSFSNNNICAKLEMKDTDVLFAFSCPIIIDNEVYIVELFKNLTKENTLDSMEFMSIKSIVSKLNYAFVNGVHTNSKLP